MKIIQMFTVVEWKKQQHFPLSIGYFKRRIKHQGLGELIKIFAYMT